MWHGHALTHLGTAEGGPRGSLPSKPSGASVWTAGGVDLPGSDAQQGKGFWACQAQQADPTERHSESTYRHWLSSVRRGHTAALRPLGCAWSTARTG